MKRVTIMTYTVVLSIIILTSVCILFKNDFFHWCIANKDYTEELSGGYVLIDESLLDRTIIERSLERNKIPKFITDWDYNNDFIIAIQKPLDSKECKCYESRSRGRGCDKKWQSYEEICANYIFNISKKFNYWIIVHSNDSLYGPMTKKEFSMKRKKLNIPEVLEVKE